MCVALLLELSKDELPVASEGLPVDVSNIIAADVGAVVCELDPCRSEGGAVASLAARGSAWQNVEAHPVEDTSGSSVENRQGAQFRRLPDFGFFGDESSRSIWRIRVSVVASSAIASKLRRIRCRRQGKAALRTSSADTFMRPSSTA